MTLIRRGKLWHYAFQMEGQRYRGSTKESVKTRAAQYEQTLMGRIRDGGQPVTRRPLRLEEWAALFLNHCTEMVAANQMARKTEIYYRDGWRLLSATKVARYRLADITADDAAVLIFPGGPSNANCALRTLRRLLNAAVERKRLIASPKIRCVEETGRKRLIEPWMETLLLKHAEWPLSDILVIIQDSGMRPDESLSGRRSHLLWERDLVEIPRSKTSKKTGTRYVPFTERMKCIFAKHKSLQDDWLYPSKRAASGHRETVSKQWIECIAAANAELIAEEKPPLPEDLVLYCGRHTFGTELYEETKDLKLVQETMGHADVTTTLKYTHIRFANASEIINARNRRRAMHVVEKTG